MTTLRILVVGGGIGGAAATRALLQRGFDVELFEQAGQLAEVGAGVAMAPNGARVLRRLGCGPSLDRLGSRWTDTAFCRPDGAIVTPIFARGDGGRPLDYHGLHRADLLSMLLEGIPRQRLHTGHRCVGFTQDGRRATVHFQNGRSVSADVVIGADGIHSALQPFVVPRARPVHSGVSAYRGIVAADAIGWPPGRARLWMGEGKHFLVFPVRHNQLVNYVGFVPTKAEMRESWSAPGDPQDLVEAFAGWDPVITKVIDQIDTTFSWGLYDREPLPHWTYGRLTLLGDAAHPMLPHQGQGANQALEDAVALAALLDRFSDDVTSALAIYQQVRQERTARVQRLSRLSGANYDAGTEHQAARDQTLIEQVTSRAWIFDYDAEVEALSPTG